VAKELNITRASEKLLISQPAITQTINKLEEQLNTKLFIRQSRGLTLTKMGELLFDEVKQALTHFQMIERMVEEEENLLRGEIVIGVGTHLSKTLLLEPITKFYEKYPNVKIKLIDKSSEELLKDLTLSQIDMVIGQSKKINNDQIVYRELLKEIYVFVCHKDYYKKINAKQPNALSKDNLKQHTFIASTSGASVRVKFDQINEKYAFNITPQIEVTGHNMSIELISKKIGIGFLPEYLVEENVNSGEFVVLPIIKEQTPLEYGYYVNKKTMSRAVREFLTFLK